MKALSKPLNQDHDELCPCELCLDMKASKNLRLRLYLLAVRKIVDELHAASVRHGSKIGAPSLRVAKLVAMALGRPGIGPKTAHAVREGSR